MGLPGVTQVSCRLRLLATCAVRNRCIQVRRTPLEVAGSRSDHRVDSCAHRYLIQHCRRDHVWAQITSEKKCTSALESCFLIVDVVLRLLCCKHVFIFTTLPNLGLSSSEASAPPEQLGCVCRKAEPSHKSSVVCCFQQRRCWEECGGSVVPLHQYSDLINSRVVSL